MSGLDLDRLKQNRESILKSEILSLILLWDKLDPNKQNKANITLSMSSLSAWQSDLMDKQIEFKDKNGDVLKTFKIWDNFIDNWRSWRNKNNPDDILQILYGIGESLNSGIDKGSPKENVNVEPENARWLANAFGSFKRKIIYLEKSEDEINSIIEEIKNKVLCVLNKQTISLDDLEKVRNELKNLLSGLLSDDRFPINDVSLWEQTYMPTSMFKALLANYILTNDNFNDVPNRQDVKWSILGIQYDKLGLAEKGLKTASINWYRNAANNVDDKIKKIIELDYALGNEVYRDETGIYFVVGENIIGDKNGDFYKLNDGLSEIKEKILEVFTEKFKGEIYPAIFLTAPSRGLMNLGHLVEKSKENFLKAEYPSDFQEKLKHDSNPNGICQICGMRLAHKVHNENLICDVCNDERIRGRIKYWLDNPDKETIWLDELQDKNGRVALITLKFELEKWLNGDMLNGLVVRNESFTNYLNETKQLLHNIKNSNDMNQLTIIWSKLSPSMNTFLDLFDRKGIKKPYENIQTERKLKKITTQPLNNLNEMEVGLKTLLFRCLDIYLKFLQKTQNDWLNFVRNTFNINLNFDINDNRIRNQNAFNNQNFVEFFKATFSIGFAILQIYNLLLERSIGSRWEEFISKNLSDKSVVNFENRTIDWSKLTNQDIEFLASLILQFLLRKNPSPARLRRIWESTEEFFKELESKIIELAEIKQERCRRLRWNNIQIDDDEYQDGDLLFWADNNNVYLISSIEKIGNKKEFKLKKSGEHSSEIITTLKRDEATEITYKPYFTILSPTPVSWQFIVPAENVPNLIENIQEEYYKKFRWVYGKLPLHIGIVVQNYKKPLYVGIKALRKIRRDKTKWQDLSCKIKGKELKERQKTAFRYQQVPETNSQCEDFYSLYEKTSGRGKYHFHLYPEKEKVWLDITANSPETDNFIIYPNTFDFEFLDTNTRRNDIFYKNGKRALKLKSNRPYDLYQWERFIKFKEVFFSDNKSSSKLQKLVSEIYSKLEDWKGDDESLKTFVLSAFINILELKSKEEKDKFAGLFGLAKFEDFQNLSEEKFKEKLFMVIDMFELWHTSLKF